MSAVYTFKSFYTNITICMIEGLLLPYSMISRYVMHLNINIIKNKIKIKKFFRKIMYVHVVRYYSLGSFDSAAGRLVC